ncbi:hypothetical protein QNO08_04805 [Arthrobacter sp. zg-Y820]|uniref:hypothetical protein n=1 Tax=unclassified Arthrobacter TaxID=235627 RepID=UPI001E4C6610|nr:MULTISPECIES: hypothetical protein [unclassified Arthrobacter]MCC9198032.1 hypothetical protein [Arthrobacter sp. zg-Y820]MDK1280899.1 hypothetical protein [Arthrobacter sp. zg.Y820]WIB10377.1 hypothetical protein QNO08_04805 [Arthrobacter sp. zg-Y820]
MIGASAVGAVAVAVSLAGAPGAFAADDYLEFSLDGVTYSRTMTGPIFKEAFQYVPGASAGATIWIRNNSDEPARLSSAAVMVRSDPQLDRQLGLTAGLAAAPGDRVALGSQGSCTDVPQVRDLASGEQLNLSLVVDLSADAPNDTMNRTADFDVVFLLESKDAAPRQACAALSGPIQPPAESEAHPGNPAPTGTAASTSELVALSAISGPRLATTTNSVFPAALPERPAYVRQPQAVVPPQQQPPAGIVPAGFQSTVEPIIRSLSGTLLIGMSVVFCAAVVLRVRKRQA